MSILVLMCVAIAGSNYSEILYPATAAIGTGQSRSYSYTALGNRISGFEAFVTKSMDCSSNATIDVTFRPGATVTLPVLHDRVYWTGDVDINGYPPIMTITNTPCTMVIYHPSVCFSNHVRSIALVILLAWIIGGVGCCILFVVVVILVCRKQNGQVSVATQVTSYQSLESGTDPLYPASPAPVGRPPPSPPEHPADVPAVGGTN
eukprot:TRINITY_DN22226_c0_g1_i1.p1 TRINITY_DN22226_c0_g1~~TRINITY_DN22226_c0_g1_i1.p1  ORF type:complete len:205 (+),score=23.55 TRINITY_DN22226_c0_g1_i1:106-720(+)